MLKLEGQIIKVEGLASRKDKNQKYQVIHVLDIDAAKIYRIMDFDTERKYELKKAVSMPVDVRADVVLLPLR